MNGELWTWYDGQLCEVIEVQKRSIVVLNAEGRMHWVDGTIAINNLIFDRDPEYFLTSSKYYPKMVTCEGCGSEIPTESIALHQQQYCIGRTVVNYE